MDWPAMLEESKLPPVARYDAGARCINVGRRKKRPAIGKLRG
jgi:hypothetical protein